jgi:hypothetical protein
VAVNDCVPPTGTLIVVGVSVTLTAAGLGVTVIVALAVFVGSVTEAPVKVTVAGVGSFAGAV